MIQEEVVALRQDMIETEDNLAQLHAYIYKRREEARKIRMSLPTQRELDKASMSQEGEEKMRKKTDKVLSSYKALREKLDARFCKKKKNMGWFWLTMVVIAILLFLIGFILYRSKYIVKCVDGMPCRDPE